MATRQGLCGAALGLGKIEPAEVPCLRNLDRTCWFLPCHEYGDSTDTTDLQSLANLGPYFM